ncbi:hypothetical protein C1646_750845 [Rhizophagus diaphanus]|nr:hypothetical protein C1646_750845 [Rhizophagus diaphanus] [Rhizophagus sp. MUCL 43196]
MSFSLNCLLLGDTSFEKIFQVTVPDYIIADGANIPIRDAQIGQFKSYILSNKKAKFSIDDPDDMNLWKVEINTDDEIPTSTAQETVKTGNTRSCCFH